MTTPATNRAVPESEQHPFDYYYREGMALRPEPEAFGAVSREAFESYLPLRRRITPVWMAFSEDPPDTPFTRLVADHRWQGDEQMDAVVGMFERIGPARGRQLLDQALERGIGSLGDPPEELAALFRQLDTLPSWFDAEMFERGRAVWVRSTIAGKLGEYLADIVGTAMTLEVGSATGATGRLQRDPIRRNLETFKFFRDVTESGLQHRFSEPFKQTVRVRLMHAQVRRGLRKAWGEEWFAKAGDPISNAVMAQGVAAFGLTPLLFDASLGRPCSRADLDAAVMYWGYIVYVFGVAEEIIPKNTEQAIAMGNYILATGAGRTKWSPDMSRTFVDYLVGAFDTALPAVVRPLGRRIAMPLVFGFMAHLLGEPITREFLDGSPYERTYLRGWSMLAGALAQANARSAGLLDQLPLIGFARKTLVPPVDLFHHYFFKAIQDLSSSKEGLTETPFDSHDHSRPSDFDTRTSSAQPAIVG